MFFVRSEKILQNTEHIRVMFKKMFSSRVKNQRWLLNGTFPIGSVLTSQGCALAQFCSKWLIAHMFLPPGMHIKLRRFRQKIIFYRDIL